MPKSKYFILISTLWLNGLSAGVWAQESESASTNGRDPESIKLAAECAKLGFTPDQEGQKKAKSAADGEGPGAQKAALCLTSIPQQALKGGKTTQTEMESNKAEANKADPKKPIKPIEKAQTGTTDKRLGAYADDYTDESQRGLAAAYGKEKAQGYADAISGKIDATKFNKNEKYDDGVESGLKQVKKSVREGTRDGAQRTVDVNRVAYDQAYAKAAARVQGASSVAEGETRGITLAKEAVVRPGEITVPGVPNNDRTLVNEAAVTKIATGGGPNIESWANELGLGDARYSSGFGPRNATCKNGCRWHNRDKYVQCARLWVFSRC
jgi:hypothetical protein